jgi:hypothetical protein
LHRIQIKFDSVDVTYMVQPEHIMWNERSDISKDKELWWRNS